MKNIRIIATLLLMIAIILSIFSNVALARPDEGAGTTDSGSTDSGSTDSGEFAGASLGTASATHVKAVDNVAGTVMKTGSMICYIAAVILIMWMGVKYITAAPEGKAELKKSLSIAAVASVLLVGAGSVLTFFGQVAPDVTEG